MRTLALCTLLISALAASAVAQDKGKKAPPVPGLTLVSPDFEDGGIIPGKYTQSVPDPISPK